MKNKLPYTFLFASSLVGMVACVADSGSSTGEDTAQVTDDLAQPNGGFTTANEAASFGIADEFTAAAIEADSGDPGDNMATDPTVSAMAGSGTVVARDVLVMWGNIPRGPNGDKRDWTGSWTVSRGAMIVRRTIAFEARDHLNLPRADAQTVAFTSHTKPASDGLALTLLDNAVTGAASPLTLTYAPADPTLSADTFQITVSDLDAGPVVIDAGDGDKIVAVAETPVDACDGGFMRGRFHAVGANTAANGGVGVYLGVVTNRAGAPVGAVRGIYGNNKVFGKFIDLQGNFVGLINGEYDATNDFQAKWIDRSGSEHGHLHGHYFDSTAVDGGHFMARWAEAGCSQDNGGGGGSGSGSAAAAAAAPARAGSSQRATSRSTGSSSMVRYLPLSSRAIVPIAITGSCVKNRRPCRDIKSPSSVAFSSISSSG